MKKDRNSILSPYAEQLTQWLKGKENGGDGLTLKDTAARLLEQYGVTVAPSGISRWWARRQKLSALRAAEEALFDSIRSGSRIMEQLQHESNQAPPSLAPLLKMLEGLIASISVKGTIPEKCDLVPELVRTAIQGHKAMIDADAAKLDREKFELMKAKAKLADDAEKVARDDTLTPEERQQKIRAIFGMS